MGIKIAPENVLFFLRYISLGSFWKMDRGGTDNALFTALNAYNKPTINCRDYPQSRGGCVLHG